MNASEENNLNNYRKEVSNFSFESQLRHLPNINNAEQTNINKNKQLGISFEQKKGKREQHQCLLRRNIIKMGWIWQGKLIKKCHSTFNGVGGKGIRHLGFGVFF